MNYKKDLPKVCPGCDKIFGEETCYVVSGLQYCHSGVSPENLYEDQIYMPDLDNWEENADTCDPYYIECDECGYVLLDREIIVNKKRSKS